MDGDSLVRRPLESLQLRVSHERHAVALELLEDLLGEFASDLVHGKLTPVDEGGLQVQTSKRLTHL